jgi:hypothetical protein
MPPLIEERFPRPSVFVNDVTALRGDPGMAEVVAGSGAYLCLMRVPPIPDPYQQLWRPVTGVQQHVARNFRARLSRRTPGSSLEGSVSQSAKERQYDDRYCCFQRK